MARGNPESSSARETTGGVNEGGDEDKSEASASSVGRVGGGMHLPIRIGVAGWALAARGRGPRKSRVVRNDYMKPCLQRLEYALRCSQCPM